MVSPDDDGPEGPGGEAPTLAEGRRALRNVDSSTTMPTIDAPIAVGTREKARGLTPGTLIGRYCLLERVAEGGMGVVYAAQDPELGRRVAIKLLRVGGRRGGSLTHARERLLREAQALAQLSHPNVVAIHDVGTFDDGVFIAMELVDGRTLRQVLDAGDTGWRARLALLIAAGRGLAAAHRAGLVHRDFKPDNVVVGDDGRVRVLDFGLARAAHLGESISSDDLGAGAPASPDAAASPSGALHTPAPVESSERLRAPLTELGSVLGTPAYMAPEQRRSGTTDAQSDQYSFCVAAWELLYGARPFAGRTAEEVGDEAGAPVPPAGATVPAWVRRILARGMALEPAARFPSMDALLDALARDPAVARRRVLGAVAVAVAAVAATLAFALPGRHAAGTAMCQDAPARLAGVWGSAEKQAVRTAFAASGRSYGADTYARVERALDEYLSGWVTMRREACEATRVRGVQSEHLLDLRMRCLDRRLHQVQALTTLFAGQPGDAVLKQAISAVYALPPLARCADLEALGAARPPPEDPKTAAAVDELRGRVDAVSALMDAGAYAEGLTHAVALVADARRVGFDPVLAEALYALGFLQNHTGDPAAADATLREAILVGSRSGEDHAVASSWVLLVYNLGMQARYADALAVRGAAEAAVARIGDEPKARGQYLANVGTIFNRQEKYAESRPYFEQAIATLEAAFGPEHPSLAGPLSNLGNVLGAYAQYDDARRAYERAIAIYEKAYGPDHPMLAVPVNNLANMLVDQGKYEEARRYYARAMDVWRGSVGEEHPNLANAWNSLGTLEFALGNDDAAERSYARAQVIWEKTLGPEHPDVGMAMYNRGEVLLRKGDARAACARFEQALALEEKTLAPDDSSLAYPLTGLGKCRLALGEPALALPALERSLKIRLAVDSPAAEMAETRWTIARVLRALRRDPRRARALAQQAYDDLTPPDDLRVKALRAEIAAWLKAEPR